MEVELRVGKLRIRLDRRKGHLFMTGPWWKFSG